MSIVVGLLSFAIQIVAVVWVVRLIVRVRKRGAADPFSDPGWATRPAFTATDAASQLLLAAGVVLAQVALLVVDQRAGEPVALHLPILFFVVVLFAAAYRFRSPILLAAAAADAVAWWLTALLVWSSKGYANVAPLGILFLGVALWGAGRISESIPRNERFANVYWALGMITTALVLFVLSTQGGLDMMSEFETYASSSWRIASATAALGVLALTSVLFAWRRGAAHRLEAAWLSVVVVAMMISALFPLSPADVFTPSMGGAPTLSGAATAWAAAFNLLLLTGLLGLALLGYVRREDGLITLSAVLLFVFVVVKYFDWLFSLLDRSVAFIGAGVLLLGAGFLMERGRRFAIGAMEGGRDE